MSLHSRGFLQNFQYSSFLRHVFYIPKCQRSTTLQQTLPTSQDGGFRFCHLPYHRSTNSMLWTLMYKSCFQILVSVLHTFSFKWQKPNSIYFKSFPFICGIRYILLEVQLECIKSWVGLGLTYLSEVTPRCTFFPPPPMFYFLVVDSTLRLKFVLGKYS